MVFKQLGQDTDILIKKFGVFGKTFKDIGKDFTSGIGMRSLTNIITKKDVESLNSFITAIKKGANYTEAFNTHLSNSPIQIKRQANEIIKLNNQQKVLKRQLDSSKISQEEYNTAMDANNAQLQQITKKHSKTYPCSESIGCGW